MNKKVALAVATIAVHSGIKIHLSDLAGSFETVHWSEIYVFHILSAVTAFLIGFAPVYAMRYLKHEDDRKASSLPAWAVGAGCITTLFSLVSVVSKV